MTALPKKRLGRGLAALIGDDLPTEAEQHVEPVARDGLKELPIEQITSNKLNPRKVFNEEDLEDLARSIGEVIAQYEPRLSGVKVRVDPKKSDSFELHFKIIGKLAMDDNVLIPVTFATVVDPDGRITLNS